MDEQSGRINRKWECEVTSLEGYEDNINKE